MRIYNLTIAYDEDSDNVEYIEETLEDVKVSDQAFAELAKQDYERTSTLDVIKQLKDIAES